MQSPPSAKAPDPAQLLIGMYVKALRLDRGLTQLQAAEKLGIHASTLGRMEQASVRLRLDVVERLLRCYQVPGNRIRPVHTLLDAGGSRCSDSMPGWSERLAACERQAAAVRVYSGRLIPPVLRTPAYAAAVLSAAPDDGERAAAAARPPVSGQRLTVFLHEYALWPVSSDPAVLREQFAHLRQATAAGHTDIRIVLATAHAPVGQGHTLSELVFPHGHGPLYVVENDHALYCTGADGGSGKRALLDALHTCAQPSRRTPDLLDAARERWLARCVARIGRQPQAPRRGRTGPQGDSPPPSADDPVQRDPPPDGAPRSLSGPHRLPAVRSTHRPRRTRAAPA
ncbi:Scr1 family TA system antitoxin-like transcriptional regulator [Streptomyces sp. NPDC045470]|uniref:Scr1 family TA system antitoxin-like transcriptional regulator n=1 Tax=Streptomyces sp. NPDC045470 TaxID=3155469 RepID=UPI0033F4E05B